MGPFRGEWGFKLALSRAGAALGSPVSPPVAGPERRGFSSVAIHAMRVCGGHTRLGVTQDHPLRNVFLRKLCLKNRVLYKL